MPNQVELSFRLGRRRQQRMQFLGEGVLPKGDGLDPLSIGILQGKDDADADLS